MNWFLSLSYLLRIGMGLIAAFAMFVIIANLNLSREESELVWANGDRAISHKPEAIPLSIFVDSSFGSAHTESLLEAVDGINMVGCTLVIVVPNLDAADIHIRHEACDRSSNHPGCTWLNPASGQIVIQIGQPGNVTMSYLLFFHELTHAFGLAHDGVYPVPDKSYDALTFVPITANNAVEHAYRLDQGKLLPGLSGKDSAALSSRYCPSL